MPDDQKPTGTPLEKPITTQEEFDAQFDKRWAREKAKVAPILDEYESLKKFKSEHEKQLEEATQKELEARKEYETLKSGWSKKEQDYQSVLSKKEAEIADMKVSNALISEITKQNAYAEETMALLKTQATFDKEGNVRIKGRDSNGLEVMDSVEEGVKKFLVQRPHLVKATNRSGAGTGSSTVVNGAAASNDLMSLNVEYAAARARGDYKKANELSKKMKETVRV